MTYPAHITKHAIDRYRKRVCADLTDDQIIEILNTPAIIKAIEFGATGIILGTGHIARVANGVIVTINPKHRLGNPSVVRAMRKRTAKGRQRYEETKGGKKSGDGEIQS